MAPGLKGSYMDQYFTMVLTRADKIIIKRVKSVWYMRCPRHRLTLITPNYNDVRRHLMKDRNG